MKICFKLLLSLLTIASLTSNAFALGDNQTLNEDGQVVETFHINSDLHLIALTSDTTSLLRPFPSNIQDLYEPKLVGGLAVLSKITDSSGEVVGFATELEDVTTDANGITTAKVEWIFKLPGRGTIMVTQTEDFTSLIALAIDMIVNGEAARYLTPPLTVVTTVAGTGQIVAGLGEFEGVSGSFQETNAITYLNVVDGTIGVDITLQLTFDDDQGEDQP